MTGTRGSSTSQCQRAPSTEGHSTAQGAGGVICSVESSVLSGCPVTREAFAPLPSLCSSLPSHNIKTVPLCLYPWQPASNNGESSGLSMGGVRCHGEEKQGRGRYRAMENWQRGWAERESEGTSCSACRTRLCRSKQRNRVKG